MYCFGGWINAKIDLTGLFGMREDACIYKLFNIDKVSFLLET